MIQMKWNETKSIKWILKCNSDSINYEKKYAIIGFSYLVFFHSELILFSEQAFELNVKEMDLNFMSKFFSWWYFPCCCTEWELLPKRFFPYPQLLNFSFHLTCTPPKFMMIFFFEKSFWHYNYCLLWFGK